MKESGSVARPLPLTVVRDEPEVSAAGSAGLGIGVIQVCFFLSGLSALIYEVAWLSRIQLVMGHTVYSLATTLAAYLSGLALGGLLVSRLKRSGLSSLWLYFIAELAIGAYGLVFSPLLRVAELPYHWLASAVHLPLSALSLLQFIFCGGVIFLPTILMGTTLPILCDHLYGARRELPARMPTLYAINTLGAFAGSLAAGFVILPALGYSGTILFAAAINISLFLIAKACFSQGALTAPGPREVWAAVKRVVARNAPTEAAPAEPSDEPLDLRTTGEALALFVSGVSAMLVQVTWNRLAGLCYGSSVYVFPLVTSIVLLGIVLGSLLARRLTRDLRRARYALPYVMFGAAALFIAGTYAFTFMPLQVLYWHQKIHPGFALYSLLEFVGLLVCLGPAATALGALFPLAAAAFAAEGKDSSVSLGLGCSVNIGGLIAGALLGSFLILPYFGLEAMTHTVFVLLAATALLLSVLVAEELAAALGLAALAAIVLTLVPSFDRLILTSGFFYNRMAQTSEDFPRTMGITSYREFARVAQTPLLAYRDDPHATISLHLDPADGITYFKVNGKPDGGLSSGDLATVRIVANLPALVRPDAKSALVIGLGTGITASQLLQYPAMRSTKVIELSEAMIEFSHLHFAKAAGKLWDDPRFAIENRDGREFLRHSSETFDIIASEPSNPWLDGVGNLFTKEYYELIAKRLSPNGVASLWFHSYGLNCESIASVLLAISQVFGSYVVFDNDGDLFILAQKGEGMALRAAPAAARAQEDSIFHDLLLNGTRLEAFSQLVVNKIGLLKEELGWFTRNFTANTDDNQLLQYVSGRTFYEKLKCHGLRSRSYAGRRQAVFETIKASVGP